MSITIQGVPEFLTRDQYVALFEGVGLDPSALLEVRYAPDGIHALVFAQDRDGCRFLNTGQPHSTGYHKHRVFIPVLKDDADERTTRVTPIKN